MGDRRPGPVLAELGRPAPRGPCRPRKRGAARRSGARPASRPAWSTGAPELVGALVVVVAHPDPDVGGGQLDVAALGAGGSDRCHLVRMPSGCSGGAGVLGVIGPLNARLEHRVAGDLRELASCSSGFPRSWSRRSPSPTGGPGPTPRRTRSRRSGSALRLGATGLESDVWLTADGVAVLDHDGVVGGLRRRPHRRGRAAAEPARPHPDARRALRRVRHRLRAVARRQGRRPRSTRCSPSRAPRAATRSAAVALPPRLADGWPHGGRSTADVQLVDSTRLRRDHGGPRAPRGRRSPTPASTRVNLHHTDWNGGLTALFHRFERCAFGVGRCSTTSVLRPRCSHGHRRRVQRPRRPHDGRRRAEQREPALQEAEVRRRARCGRRRGRRSGPSAIGPKTRLVVRVAAVVAHHEDLVACGTFVGRRGCRSPCPLGR